MNVKTNKMSLEINNPSIIVQDGKNAEAAEPKVLHKLKKKDAAKDEGRQGGIIVLVAVAYAVVAVLA